MSFLSNLRLPFRDDHVLGILMLSTLLVPLVFTLPTYEHYELVKFCLMLALVGAGFIALVVRFRRQGIFELRTSKAFLILLALFWIAAVAATIFSTDRNNSIFGFYTRFTNGLLFYTALVLYVVLGMSLVREKAVYLLKVLVFSGFLVAVYGILQSWGIAFYTSLNAPVVDRSAPSFLGNPNFSTMFLATMLPLLMYFWIRSESLRSKLYYGVVWFVYVWAIAVLASRGAELAVVASLVFAALALVRTKETRRHVLYILAAIGIIAGLSYAYLQLTRPGTVALSISGSESSANLRYEVWGITWRQIVEEPLGKYGLGNFQIFFEQHRPKFMASQNGVFDDAHNLVLQMALTGGVQLALLFIAVLALPFMKLLREFFRTKDELFLAVAAGIVAFGVAACFNPVTVACFLALAVLVAAANVASYDPLVVKMPRMLQAGGVAFGTLMVLVAGSYFAAELIFFQGLSEYLAGRYGPSLRHMRFAILLNPTNQLYYAYRTGSEIYLEPNNPVIPHHIRQMADIHPTTSYSYARAATLYFRATEQTNRLDYYNESLASLTKALSMDQFFAARYGRLGYFLFRGHRYDDARMAFKASLSLDENYLPSLVLLAKEYQIERKRPQMVFVLQKAATLHPELQDLQLWYRLAKDEKFDIDKIPIPVVPDDPRLEQ